MIGGAFLLHLGVDSCPVPGPNTSPVPEVEEALVYHSAMYLNSGLGYF